MTQLFTTIAEADRDDILEDVTATYDAVLGYPRTIALRCTPAVADCGITSCGTCSPTDGYARVRGPTA